MSHIEGEITIDRPVAEVFDFVADERNEPRYNTKMIDVEKVSPGPISRGTRFRATSRSMGRISVMAIEFTDFDRPAQISSSTALAGMDVHGAVTFGRAGSSTRMRWSWNMHPRGAVRLITPLFRVLGPSPNTPPETQPDPASPGA